MMTSFASATPVPGIESSGLMKLDPDRLAATIHEFATLRLPGSAAQSTAIDRLERGFRDAGLEVLRSSRIVAPSLQHEASPLEVWPAAALAVLMGLVLEARLLGGRPGPGPVGLAVMFGTLALVALIGRRLATGRWGASRVEVADLLAHAPPAGEALPTLLIVTHSDTRPPADSVRWNRWFGRLDWAWLALLWIPCFVFGGREWLERAGPALLVGLAFLATLRRLDPWCHEREPYVADNRTGLALVESLAQHLPASLAGRVDVRFLTLGAPIESWAPSVWPERVRSWRSPALILAFDAPAIGTSLQLDGAESSLQRLGLATARDLWIPCALARTTVPGLEAQPFATTGIPALTVLAGNPPQALDPRLLAAAGQWAFELALRWERQIREADGVTAAPVPDTAAPGP